MTELERLEEQFKKVEKKIIFQIYEEELTNITKRINKEERRIYDFIEIRAVYNTRERLMEISKK